MFSNGGMNARNTVFRSHPRNVIIKAGKKYVYINIKGEGIIFTEKDLDKYIKIVEYVNKMLAENFYYD